MHELDIPEDARARLQVDDGLLFSILWGACHILCFLMRLLLLLCGLFSGHHHLVIILIILLFTSNILTFLFLTLS